MSLILSGTDGLSDVDGTAATPAIRGTDANTGIFFGTDIIGFSEGGAECARFDSSGNFGIGTTSPSTFGKVAVEVAGTTTPTSLTTVGPSSINLYAATNGTSTNGTTGIFGWNSTSGIGSGIGFSRENSADWGTQIRFYTHPTSTTNIGDITERMRLDSSGRLLVGLTSSINGAGQFAIDQSGGSIPIMTLIGTQGVGGGGRPVGLIFTGVINDTGPVYSSLARVSAAKENATSGNAAGYLDFATTPAGGSPTSRMVISSTGIVTMSAYGAGTATFSAAGVISSVSDETWKIKDGVPVDPDAMLKKLEPGYWFYNDEKKETFGTDRQLGFYAQNVNSAIGPEAAPTPEEGKPWGYYDRSVLAVTVMSLQKALATIETLTARITALESA